MTTSTSETSPASPQPSPLSEVDPQSLNQLFSTAPDELTDAQVDKIVLALEQDRKKFLEAEAAPKAAKKAPKVAADPGLSIDDLEL